MDMLRVHPRRMREMIRGEQISLKLKEAADNDEDLQDLLDVIEAEIDREGDEC